MRATRSLGLGRISILCILFSTSQVLPSAQAAIQKRNAPTLSDQERSELRERLSNLWNEVELLLRNQKSLLLDIRRQEKEFKVLRVFDRIPLQERIEALEEELTQSAREHSLTIRSLKVISRSQPGPELPTEIYTDSGPLRPEEKQIAQEIRIRIRGKGDLEMVRHWTGTWKDDLVRILEPAKKPFHRKGTPSTHWEMEAIAYRFRDLKFPRLRARDPVTLLPRWARSNLAAFIDREPRLWSFVGRIQANLPKTEIPYQDKGRFLINAARMSYFSSRLQLSSGN